MTKSFPIAEKKPMAAMQYGVKIAAKDAGLLGTKHQVILVLDISGSMEFTENRFYSHGIIDGLVRRILALGLTFDDNGTVPVYLLDNNVRRVPEDLTATNLEDYVDRFVRRHVGGGTNYAPTINKVIDDLEAGDPALVIFLTDGDNGDHPQAEQAMRRASGVPAFFMFLGVHGSGSPASFSFLRKLDELSGRVVDNAGFNEVPLHDITEAELLALLLEEYKGYPALAQRAGLLNAQGKWDGRPHSPTAASRVGGVLGGLFGR